MLGDRLAILGLALCSTLPATIVESGGLGIPLSGASRLQRIVGRVVTRQRRVDFADRARLPHGESDAGLDERRDAIPDEVVAV